MKPQLSNDVFFRESGDEELDVSAYNRTFLELISQVTVNSRGNLELPLSFKEDIPLPQNKLPVYMRTWNTLGRINDRSELGIKCRENMQSYYRGIKFVPIFSLQTVIFHNAVECVASVSREYGWLLASLAYMLLHECPSI